jgi:hypothetical protein
MRKPAIRPAGKPLPLPSKREAFELTAVFSEAEAERMRMGHKPEEMEDKWFVFFEEGWLYFLRSWTGICIYALRLESTPNGVRVAEGWANREEGGTFSDSIAADKQNVQDLIQSRLLTDYVDDDSSDPV